MKTKIAIAVLVALGSFGTVAHAQNQGQYSKLWWGGAGRSGEGTPISHQVQVNADGSKVDKLFGVWFHYGPTNAGEWLTFTCQSLAKDTLGRDTCSGQLARVKGPQPMVFNPNAVSVTSPGDFTLTFNSVTSATFTYNFETLPGLPRQVGTINWEPQIFAVDNTALRYVDAVVGIWTAGYPVFPDEKTRTVTKVINKTSFVNTASEYSYINCWLASKPLSDGKIPTSCQETRTGNARKNLYINPITKEMYDYTGVLPADIVWLVTASNSDKPEWGAKARVSNGWYFTTFNQTSILNFQPDVGASFVVKAGTFAIDGSVNLLVAYTMN